MQEKSYFILLGFNLELSLIKDFQGAICINRYGGVKEYWCECKRGFKRLNHQVCEDIDECYEGSAVCGDLMCVNTEGGYDCLCPTGYTSDKTTEGQSSCRDIDECTETDHCGLYGCENFPGDYICECPLHSQWNPLDHVCTIIQEDFCNIQLSNPCGEFGKCIPEGLDGYHCQCIAGYTGDESDDKYCTKVIEAPEITCRSYDCTVNDCTALDRIEFGIYGCSNGDDSVEDRPPMTIDDYVIDEYGSYYDSWIGSSSEDRIVNIDIDYKT